MTDYKRLTRGDGDLRLAVPIECIDELLKEYENDEDKS